ncbi:MAG: AtpZ/AtpI family protein [Candidatus Obscuribacterales bacterium]|nr:AtpZ/AtpI family protein [Candidatus Obscuribacterales bacterium]
MKEGSSPESMEEGGRKSFKETIDAKQKRMLESRREESTVWIGFTSFGVIGWTIVFPLLAGIALGVWLDNTFPATHSWTLMLLSAGLIFGCISSWRWVEEERQRTEKDGRRRRESVDRQLAERNSGSETEISEIKKEPGL